MEGDKEKLIDEAISDGVDRFTHSERAKLRKYVAEMSEDDLAKMKEMLESYKRSEWLWGKLLSISKYCFLAAGAAVAAKTLFGDSFKIFWHAFMQAWTSKP